VTRVTAPGRLHFGLLNVPGGDDSTRRAFGGVGLMLEQPGVVVSVRRGEAWQFEGHLASRAQEFALRFVAGLPDADRRPFQVLVERCPAEHTGLGVGTALGLSVAKALAAECGFEQLSAVDLAARVGRGARSAVGVHGFDLGGLIVEAGKLPGEVLSPLVAHVALPDEWRVVVFTPSVQGKWHGNREQRAFDSARTASRPDVTAELCRVAVQGIVPAAQCGDLAAFGDAVHEFNRRAGEPFAAAQGGVYASGEVAALVEFLRAGGVRGVGQSSWGPTVFAVVGSEGEASACRARVGEAFRGVPAVVTRVAPPRG
jgi:beta-ribofuranosylaminobenzene 5'-phosphate synthase